MAGGGRAGHLAGARSAVVVPGHLQPGREPGAPLPGRPGPRHPGPLLRPVPRPRPSPRPVAPARSGPGAARAPGLRGPRRLAADAPRGDCWPGSTTSPISSWPRPWPRGSSTGSTRPRWPRWSRRAPSRRARAGRRCSRPPPKALRPRLDGARGAGRAPARRGADAAPGPHPGPRRGFAEVAWRWARGERLDRVLERAELAPGDFVRNVKQLIDLLRQLAAVGPDTADGGAVDAADSLQRGVVAASAAPALAARRPRPPTPAPTVADGDPRRPAGSGRTGWPAGPGQGRRGSRGR